MELYTAITLLNVMAMLIMELFAIKSSALDQSKRENFIALFFCLMVCTICEWAGATLQYQGSRYTRSLHILIKTVELSIGPFIGLIIGRLIKVGTRFDRLIACILALNAVLEILSAKLGFIFYVDDSNVYHHMKFYWIYVVSYYISVAYVIYCGSHAMKKYQYNGGSLLVLLTLFFATSSAIQLAFPNVKVYWFVTTYCSVFLYVFNSEMIQQTDSMTGLLNRRGFETFLLTVHNRTAIIYFDIDRFKEINDVYGHGYGDTVLKNIGSAIREAYIEHGKCFRIGGDEFCVVLTSNLEMIDKYNEIFLSKIAEKTNMDQRFPYVSLGYSIFDGENDKIADTILQADMKMYNCKQERKLEAGV